MKKILIYLLLSWYATRGSHYLSQVLSINCISQESIDYQEKKSHYIYAHKKFCKVVNFHYYYDIIEHRDSYDIALHFLMCYADDHEVELLPATKKLKNEYEWHVQIEGHKIESTKKVAFTLEDSLIFGKNNIRFGQLYEAKTNISKEKIEGNSVTVELRQHNRKVCFGVSLCQKD